MAIVFDVYVVAGWALSLFCLVGGIYWLIKMRNHRESNYGFKVVGSIVIFVVTTLFGYALSQYVETDFTQFAKSLDGMPPKNKSELLRLGDQRLGWITRKSLLSYANADGQAIAKLRIFPYQIGEYDFYGGQFKSRAYD